MISTTKTEYLNVEDAAEFLTISRSTLYRYMKRGEIQFIKGDSFVRFHLRDLRNFMDSKRTRITK